MKLTIVANWENKTIPLNECIENLLFSDEILLYGNGIGPTIKEVVKSPKVKIFQLENNVLDSSIKNLMLSKAKGKWVFFINSNEVIDMGLRKEISNKINSNKFDGYFVKIDHDVKNKLIHTKEYINMYQLRLGKKGVGIWESESNGVETWELMGNMGILKKPLIRIVNPTLQELVHEINEFTTFRAKELFMENRKEDFISTLFFPIGKFFIDYFLKRGFMHGTKGFIYAVTMSFRTFLTRAKLWLLWKNESS